jgi:hypothetical protein
MERKLFPGIPDSFIISSIPFAYLFFYLFYISLRQTALLSIEFYSLSLIPILFITSIRGRAFFDAIGFNLNDAPLYVIIGRFLILAFVGVFFGFFAYKLVNFFAMQLFPFDVFYLQLTSANPLVLSIIDTAIIAFYEEIIRIVPVLGYANAFYKRGFKEGESIIYGTFLGSFMFVLMHFFAWGGLNLMNILIMTTIVIFMTLIGWLLYYKELWGILTFKEFSCISSMLCHFIYDLQFSLSLRVLPGVLPMLLGLI